MKTNLKMYYLIGDKEFDSYDKMKLWAYFNLKTGEKETAFEIEKDLIWKVYDIYKQEGRLIIRKTYDLFEEEKENSKKNQLNLFE